MHKGSASISFPAFVNFCLFDNNHSIMVRQCLNVVMWLRVYTCMHVHVHVHGCVCVCMCLECRMLIVVHRYNAFVEVRTPFRIWLLLPPCEVGSLLLLFLLLGTVLQNLPALLPISQQETKITDVHHHAPSLYTGSRDHRFRLPSLHSKTLLLTEPSLRSSAWFWFSFPW